MRYKPYFLNSIIWSISMSRNVLLSLKDNQMKEYYEQGTNKNRPGLNHHATCRLDPGFFVKIVKKDAPEYARNIKDHHIQNILAVLKDRNILITELHFPKTHAMIKNILPSEINILQKNGQFYRRN